MLASLEPGLEYVVGLGLSYGNFVFAPSSSLLPPNVAEFPLAKEKIMDLARISAACPKKPESISAFNNAFSPAAARMPRSESILAGLGAELHWDLAAKWRCLR